MPDIFTKGNTPFFCIIFSVLFTLVLTGFLLKPITSPVPVAGFVRGALIGSDEGSEETTDFSILEHIRSYDTGLTFDEERSLASLIYFESMKYGYDPEFILAIIQIESAFNIEAVSRVGARGLMQIMPATGREIATEFDISWDGVNTLYDPEVNVSMGIYYLFKMLLKYQDLRLALVAYNCGPGYVDKMLFKGENLPNSYVEKVMGAYETIKTQGM